MAKSADKACQLFFLTDNKSEATLLKPKLDAIFHTEHYDVQSVWISDTGRITYHFYSDTAIDNLMRTYPIVDGRSCIPRHPRFVQPVFGLEIAINGVGDYPQARALIDHYIQTTYGPKFGSDVVRRSRIMLDGNVYCAVLKNPIVTSLFLSDEFNLFKNKPRFTSSVPTWQPDYLYNLNIQGFPTTTSSFRQTLQNISPQLQTQLDILRSQTEVVSRGLQKVADSHHTISSSLNETNDRLLSYMSNFFLLISANNQLMMAQTDLNSLKSEASTTRLMSMFIKDDHAQAHLTQHLQNLDREIEHSRGVISQLNQDASALRQLLLPSVPSSTLPQITAMPTETSPSQPLPPQRNKHPCTEQDPTDDDEADAREVASSSAMQIDTSSQVTATLPHPSLFLNVPTPEVKLAHYLTFEGGHIVSPSLKTCTVTSRFPPNVFPYSPRYLYLISYLILLFFILSHVLLASASAAFVFRSIAINANGLSDPMKIAALSSMTRSAKPHILIIGETKSVHHVSSRLTIPDYDFHENPGQPAVGTRNCGKWGIIVGVRRGLFNVQPLQLHPSLDGHVLALDLIIPTTEGGGFTHRLIGIYAPWDPGNQDSNFWHSLSTLCSSSPFSWSVHGDFNATLSFAESSSTAPQIDNSRQAYSAFLQETNGLDLWRSQPILFKTLSHIKLANVDLVNKPLFSSKAPLIVLPHHNMVFFLRIFMS